MDRELEKLLDLDPKATIATRGYFSNYPVKAYVVKNQCALIVGCTDQLCIHCVGRDKNDLAALLKEYQGLSDYTIRSKNGCSR